jgi:dTMP kinase
MQKGKFIVVEGLDGSGKTTLIENIVNSLNGIVPIKSLIDILPRGKCIRECIGNKEHYGNDLSIALLYLSETTRVKDIIEEYLKNGVDVIVDRWFYSTMAYTNNKYIDIIDNVSKYLPNIDMTIYVDVDIDTLIKRISNKLGEDVFTNKDKLVNVGNCYKELKMSNQIIFNNNFEDDSYEINYNNLIEKIKEVIYK